MNFLDKTISFFSPSWALQRTKAREAVNIWAGNTGYGSHGGGGWEKPTFRGWRALSLDADSDIVDSIETLRYRSRDLYMSDSLVAGAIKTIRTNVVGSGLMLMPKVDAAALNISEEEALAWSEKTLREWNLWAETQSCDAERTKDFYQIQGLLVVSALMSGDVFVSLPMIKRTGDPYSLRIYPIEADRVCNEYKSDVDLTRNVSGGIEVDEYGAVVAYWIANKNPDASSRDPKTVMTEWKRVPAFGAKTGRRNILHILADNERPAQRRGVPIVAPIIEELKLLSKYNKAELTAAVVSSLFTVFVKTEHTAEPFARKNLPGLGIVAPDEEKTSNRENYRLGPGSIVALDPDESIEFADPSHPHSNFDSFVTSVSRRIGSALELPYELLIKNFTASYSASRASLLEAWKMFRMRRGWLVSSFCQPVYEAWLEEAVVVGRIKCPGFFDDPAIRAAWCRAEWYGDSQGQLDPLKEVNAAKVRVDEGFSTRERETAELTGQNFRTVLNTRKQEEDLRKDFGLDQIEPVSTSTQKRVNSDGD